ncbi:hypothetical protein M0L20_24590 [Spirosoma sp. RP8]|uniref:Uncharacterized protein n=1 Tax=Spirosoma liriopis TaxID=2937440 RepID=A0ABT0HSC2_9BACT|nr:hypothetical protein [Spirosoma liriopis]MCK8495073.1 hypothetical protein [Spirosoma liriopis]
MKTIRIAILLLALAGSGKVRAQAGGNLSDHASPNSKARTGSTRTKPSQQKNASTDKSTRQMGNNSGSSTTSSQGNINRGNKSGTKPASTSSKSPKNN